jgi:7,8-dihydropterin-6-yl-methyl-4-(beta-D-ribofuranosyl)aminobenzene 5'-phosphate synthase
MKLTSLVDNAVSPQSPFWAEHGLAFLIETESGRVLFDTGASGTVLLHNLHAANIAPESISALALSHSHPDHTGGLPAFLEHRSGLPVYAHPELLRERFVRREGRVEAKALPLAPEELRQRTDLRLSTTPQEILPGVWTSGEISERTEAEGRSPNHLVCEGDHWAPDPYQDDMALALEGSEGLVLVCGCCHAGLLNTLGQVRKAFGRDPVTVVGGLHLLNADLAGLRHLVDVLQQWGPPTLYPNHCTGQRAYVALAKAFGDRVLPCPAGTVLDFLA